MNGVLFRKVPGTMNFGTWSLIARKDAGNLSRVTPFIAIPALKPHNAFVI